MKKILEIYLKVLIKNYRVHVKKNGVHGNFFISEIFTAINF